MQKTQLTSAIEKIHNTRVNLEKELEAKPVLDTNTVTRHVLEQKIFTYIGIEDYLVSLLPQDRQDVEKAYADGFNKVWGDGKAVQIHEHEYIDRAGIPIEKEYFDTTFTQYKP